MSNNLWDVEDFGNIYMNNVKPPSYPIKDDDPDDIKKLKQDLNAHELEYRWKEQRLKDALRVPPRATEKR